MKTNYVECPDKEIQDFYYLEYARLGHTIQDIGDYDYLVDGDKLMSYSQLRQECIRECVAANC